MLCSQGPSLRLADRVLAVSDLEKQFNSLDFSCIYERKAQCELASEEVNSAKESECKCSRPHEVAIKQDKHSCNMHQDFLPSLAAINEEQGENDTSMAELGMKYDLTLPDKHYHQAKNMGYLQHRKGRHYRRKAFANNNDFPRRPRSITF
jgi:hypothetical protein